MALQVKIVDKPVKPLTLADVRPGERFKLPEGVPHGWHVRLASERNHVKPPSGGAWYAYSEQERSVWMFWSTNSPVEIDGRPASPATQTVPVGDLSQGDVFEWCGELFLCSKSRSDGSPVSINLNDFVSNYSSGQVLVTPRQDAVLTITR